MVGRGTRRGLAPPFTPTETTSDQPSLEAPSTLSSAPLPRNFNISLAGVGKPSTEQLQTAYVSGAETISDVADAASYRATLVALPRRRGLYCRDASQAESSRAALWRNAGLAYPCTCTLSIWPRAYIPPVAPPTTAQLAPIPPHPEPHHVPRFGGDLLPWSPVDFGEVDLDSALDDMAEFESYILSNEGWVTSSPRPDLRDTMKGKACAEQPCLPPSSFLPVPPSASSVPPSSFLVPATPEDPPIDYLTDAEERRTWWRNHLDADTRWGASRMWECIPRHAYSSLYTPPEQRQAPLKPVFKLPRNLYLVDHPCHPDIFHYAAHAKCRVYWIIPVHGPVIIPGLQDPVRNEDARPWTSTGELVQDETDLVAVQRESDALPRPATVQWSPRLLKSFVEDKFVPIWKDPTRPYGALHLALSGPKPDPYLNLPPRPPLLEHDHTPGHSDRRPVRPEAADHIRLYCDAARAMSVRLWLHWWTVDTAELYGGDETGDDTTIQPFKRARFALVGPRGEMLVVA